MFEDYLIAAVGGFFVLLATVLVTFLVYIMGYGIGLWSVTCAADSSQPHCVNSGWGQHISVTVKNAGS